MKVTAMGINTRCYVISTADRERVLLLAQHYQLDRFVKDYIFADAENKYQDIASKLKVDPSKIILSISYRMITWKV